MEWIDAPTSPANLEWLRQVLPDKNTTQLVEWLIDKFSSSKQGTATVNMNEMLKVMSNSVRGYSRELDFFSGFFAGDLRLPAQGWAAERRIRPDTGESVLHIQVQNQTKLELDLPRRKIEFLLGHHLTAQDDEYCCILVHDAKLGTYKEIPSNNNSAFVYHLGPTLVVPWRLVECQYVPDPLVHRKSESTSRSPWIRLQALASVKTLLPGDDKKKTNQTKQKQGTKRKAEEDKEEGQQQEEERKRKKPKLGHAPPSAGKEEEKDIQVKPEPLNEQDAKAVQDTVDDWKEFSRRAEMTIGKGQQFGALILSPKVQEWKTKQGNSDNKDKILQIKLDETGRLNKMPWSQILSAYDESVLPSLEFSYERALETRRIPEGDPRPGLIGQLGVYCRVNVPAWSVVGRYAGVMCFESEVGQYAGLLALTDWESYGYTISSLVQDNEEEDGLVISGIDNRQDFGSIGKYVNDFRNSSKQANVEFVEVIRGGFPYVFLVSTTKITAGEELLLDYGQAYWDAFVSSRRKAMLQLEGVLQSVVRGRVPDVPISVS